MDKRYQVFVSSTYADLKEERQRVTQTLMEMDCIPAGMELFPAIDEEQWQFIKRVIDDCDYYIVIIGGRYGSLTSDGVGYTEKEYDYAVSIGLKILAFVHERPEDIPVGKSDIDSRIRKKLDAFREKLKTGRLVKFWTTTTELPGLVSLSLSKTIKTYPAVGWIRARNIANDEVLADLNDLRKENDLLTARVNFLESQEPAESLNLAGLSESFEFKVEWDYRGRDRMQKAQELVKATWSDIFAAVGPSLVELPNDSQAGNAIAGGLYRKAHKESSAPSGIRIAEDDHETIRVQLSAIGLIEVKYLKTTKGSMGLFWAITGKGQQQLLKLRTVKSSRS